MTPSYFGAAPSFLSVKTTFVSIVSLSEQRSK